MQTDCSASLANGCPANSARLLRLMRLPIIRPKRERRVSGNGGQNDATVIFEAVVEMIKAPTKTVETSNTLPVRITFYPSWFFGDLLGSGAGHMARRFAASSARRDIATLSVDPLKIVVEDNENPSGELFSSCLRLRQK